MMRLEHELCGEAVITVSLETEALPDLLVS